MLSLGTIVMVVDTKPLLKTLFFAASPIRRSLSEKET
jgi:hypothetical protein